MLKKHLKILSVTSLLTAWLLTGWPQIWPIGNLGKNTLRIPPRIESTKAAVSYVGGQVGSFAGVTTAQTITFSLTNGSASVPAAGDLVVVAYSVGSTADRSLTIQNGSATNYTLAGTELYQNDTFDSNLRVAYRFMPSPTPETTVVLSGTGSTADAGSYTIHVFRGVDATTPLDVAVVTAGGLNSRLANPGSITPTTSGAWIYVAGAAAGSTGGNFTASYLTDFRARNQADTNDAMIGTGYLTWTSGAYDPAVFSGGAISTTNDSWTAVTLALRPGANSTPTLTVSQPDGTSDSVIAGQSYNITYTLADSDDAATVDFYYDSDSSGLNGTAITGCQDQAEGTDATCSWNTTGLSGNYYVYGIASDGVNSDVNDYSSGTLTVTAAVISVAVTTDGTISYGLVAENTSKSTIASDLNDMQTVSNDGNVTENLNIKGQNSTNWTLGATSGSNQYVHKFCNDTDNDCSSPPTNYTALTTSYQSLDTAIGVGGTIDFQLQITTPSSTSNYSEQQVDITIQAVQN